jgi:azurin
MRATISRRRWLKMAASVAGLSILSGVVSACGESAAGSTGNVTKLALGCQGDELAYDTTTLTAPAGAAIELTFENHSHHHQHNWVLVKGGAAAAEEVYAAALAAGAAQDWLPRDHPQIITHTPLVASGARATITFDAPPQAGEYIYLCTFPGHYLAGMQGVLTLT